MADADGRRSQLKRLVQPFRQTIPDRNHQQQVRECRPARTHVCADPKSRSTAAVERDQKRELLEHLDAARAWPRPRSSARREQPTAAPIATDGCGVRRASAARCVQSRYTLMSGTVKPYEYIGLDVPRADHPRQRLPMREEHARRRDASSARSRAVETVGNAARRAEIRVESAVEIMIRRRTPSIALRASLPESLCGSSVTISIDRGTMKSSRCFGAVLQDLAFGRRGAGIERDDTPFTASPRIGSGTPTTTASQTPGSSCSTFSTLARAHLLAAALDHVVGAALEVHVAVGVDPEDVAGVENALAGDGPGEARARRLLGRPPVALHHVRAAHDELADAGFDRRCRRSSTR